jgi:hypothetical protein
MLSADTQFFPLSSTQTFQIVKGLVQIMPVTPQVPPFILALLLICSEGVVRRVVPG